MCYLGLTQSKNNIDPSKNPYEKITDYESYSVPASKFESLEAAMADIYARDFMRRMKYGLKQEIPILEFKEKLINQKRKTIDSFDLI